jgi:beta-lysine 5,6-aminomutase alpha subunit
VLGEAVDLLGRIVDDGLLNAIADGTFGIMKRPADGGRGLDGVAKRAEDYWSPAAEFLEGTSLDGTSPDGTSPDQGAEATPVPEEAAR